MNKANNKQSLQTGFTLIEVMVALVIIAVALAAASRSIGVTVSNQAHLQERMYATWVAEDAIVQQQLTGTSGEQTTATNAYGRDWLVEFATEATFIPQVYKLQVKVRQANSEEISAVLYSVVGPPQS